MSKQLATWREAHDVCRRIDENLTPVHESWMILGALREKLRLEYKSSETAMHKAYRSLTLVERAVADEEKRK